MENREEETQHSKTNRNDMDQHEELQYLKCIENIIWCDLATFTCGGLMVC